MKIQPAVERELTVLKSRQKTLIGNSFRWEFSSRVLLVGDLMMKASRNQSGKRKQKIKTSALTRDWLSVISAVWESQCHSGKLENFNSLFESDSYSYHMNAGLTKRTNKSIFLLIKGKNRQSSQECTRRLCWFFCAPPAWTPKKILRSNIPLKVFFDESIEAPIRWTKTIPRK